MLHIDTVLIRDHEPLLYTSQTGRVPGYSNEPLAGRNAQLPLYTHVYLIYVCRCMKQIVWKINKLHRRIKQIILAQQNFWVHRETNFAKKRIFSLPTRQLTNVKNTHRAIDDILRFILRINIYYKLCNYVVFGNFSCFIYG